MPRLLSRVYLRIIPYVDLPAVMVGHFIVMVISSNIITILSSHVVLLVIFRLSHLASIHD